MFTKVFALLTLVTIVSSNDVIVGLKTDGTKFFDENRQANPALWRQMDNITIKAPENDVISRVVITDLRPEKDGDVKIVEGGEGQNNVTIELKSPTAFRGYEFHIEVYSSPEGQTPSDNNQQSITENVQGDPTKTTTQTSTNNPEIKLDATSKMPDLSTDKNVPAILTKDEEITDNERQGRNAKNENISTEGTTEVTSTTLKSDVSTTPVTQNTESITENHSETSSIVPNQWEHHSTLSPIPLYKSFNINPAIPVVSGKDIINNKENTNAEDEARHVRETEGEQSGKSTNEKFDVKLTNVHILEPSTKNDKEATATEISDAKPIEEKTEGKNEDGLNAPKVHTLENRKFTSFIPSKVEHPANPIAVKNDEKQRNARDAKDVQMHESLGTTTEFGEITTIDDNSETTTSSEECVTTESGATEPTDVNAQKPVNHKDIEGTTKTPIYLNDRQWNHRLNNPRLQSDDTSVKSDQKPHGDLEEFPVLDDQSKPSEKDAEMMGNNYKPSPDHMETKNPKISAITNFKEKY